MGNVTFKLIPALLCGLLVVALARPGVAAAQSTATPTPTPTNTPQPSLAGDGYATPTPPMVYDFDEYLPNTPEPVDLTGMGLPPLPEPADTSGSENPPDVSLEWNIEQEDVAIIVSYIRIVPAMIRENSIFQIGIYGILISVGLKLVFSFTPGGGGDSLPPPVNRRRRD